MGVDVDVINYGGCIYSRQFEHKPPSKRYKYFKGGGGERNLLDGVTILSIGDCTYIFSIGRRLKKNK